MFYGTEAETERTVSLDQLKNLVLGEKQEVKRFSGVDRDNNTEYIMKDAARADPHFAVQHPYDYWRVRIGSKYGTIFKPKVDIHEAYAPVQLAPFDAYLVSLSVQSRSDKYLEYLRLIESAGPNPWVEWISGKWRNRVTGESGDTSMYPVWTRDRFKETVINQALGTSFTLLDIARIDDPQYLEWAYTQVLNSLPEVKSWISEQSRVKVRWVDGKIQTDRLVGINSAMRDLLKSAADDAAVIIRQNLDKLAARTIKVQALTAASRPVSFIGPDWLDPLQPATLTDEEIARGLAERSVRTPVSSVAFAPSIQADRKKPNYILPVVLGVAAIGTVAALS